MVPEPTVSDPECSVQHVRGIGHQETKGLKLDVVNLSEELYLKLDCQARVIV